MNTFEEKFDAAPRWQRIQYFELMKSVPLEELTDLTDLEKRKLLYLAGDEQETVDVFIGLFKKLNQTR